MGDVFYFIGFMVGAAGLIFLFILMWLAILGFIGPFNPLWNYAFGFGATGLIIMAIGCGL